MHVRLHRALLFFVFAPRCWPQSELPRIDATEFLPAIRNQIEEAERTARMHPDDPEAVGALGMTLHAYQQYNPAARTYLRATLLQPKRFDWLYLLGTVRMELGEFDAARTSLESALALESASLPAQLRLAQAIAASGRFQDAVLQYRRILERHPDSPQAWYGLGRAQKLSGDGAGALQSYAKACELFPEYGAAHFALAQELRRLGRIDEARRHERPQGANNAAEPPLEDPLLNRVAELNRGTRLPMQRAADLERAGRLEDAVREQERALTADPNNVQSHVNLISLYGRLGKPETAKEHFDAVLRLQPNRSDAWYNYGVLLLREHTDLREAERAFLRALDINPDYAEARNNLGVIYEESGRLDDAASEFRKAIASRPDYPLARFHLGRILLHQERYEDAAGQFLRALEPESDRTPTYLYALATAYGKAGSRDEALHYLNKAREAARARGQSQLAVAIERDLGTISGKQ